MSFEKDYLKDADPSTFYNGDLYEPSDDGEHQVVTRNGQVYHLDYGETLEDEDIEEDLPEIEQYYIVRRFGKSQPQYQHKNGKFYTDKKNLRLFTDKKRAEQAMYAIARNSKGYLKGEVYYSVKLMKEGLSIS